MLLKPHANMRYRQSLHTLATTELYCTLQAWGEKAEPHIHELGGEPFLVFESDSLSPEAWRAASANAGCCFAAQWQEEALYPLSRAGQSYYPEELPELLKYKGKTNPDFTRMLLHCAKAASAFARHPGPLTVLDPLCGKGTTLFCALTEGNHAVGLELDARALEEADRYLERSLKLHRYKHKREEKALTLPKGRSAKCVAYTLADSPESMKRGDTRSLRMIRGELGEVPFTLPKGSCQLAVADLPYGVQHAPMEGKAAISLERLAQKAAAGCYHALAKGGAAALSFNAYTLRRERALDLLEEAGLTPLRGRPYDEGFAHWVEQAVSRDAVIAVKA